MRTLRWLFFMDWLFYTPKRFTDEMVSLAYRQFAVMLSAGISASDALDLLIKENRRAREKRIFEGLKKDLLKEAVRKGEEHVQYPAYYNPALIYVLKNQEKQAPELLSHLADELESKGSLKQRIRTAMVYPAIVLSTALIILSVILIFVIPVFEEMFATMGGALPPATQFVLDLSGLVGQHFVMIVVGLILAWGLIVKAKNILIVIATYVPILGPVLKQAALLQFTKHLSILLKMDISLPEALYQAALTIDNPIYSSKIKQLAPRTTDPGQLHSAMAATRLFPDTILQAVAVGEKTQALDALLPHLSNFYEKRVDALLDRLFPLIDIFILLFLAFTVGGMVISMYLPIFIMAGSL